MWLKTITVFVVGFFFSIFSFASKSEQVLTAVLAEKFVDVEKGRVLKNQVILIEGDRIKSISEKSKTKIPSKAIVVDLGGSYVLPGLIDAHTHITSQSENFYDDTFRKSPIDFAVTAHLYTKRTLEAGFTVCRDLGAPEFVDVALKKAIQSGKVVGPRLFVAGHALGSTGGHADLNGMSQYVRLDQGNGVADGIDGIRKKIRWNVKNGADLIKVFATAGVLSEEDSVGGPQYSLEEMKALVQEAKMWGKRVAAHAHGVEGIKRAIRAGVDSVEHGSFLDDEAIALLKEHGVYLVSDIYNDDYIVAEYQRLGFPQKMLEKERKVGATQRESFRKAVRAGVKIAFGTDAGVYPHGWNAKQFAKMVQFGMTPVQAVQSATVVAADLLGQSQNIGSLSPQKYADIIAVHQNPFEDVSTLEHVFFVMKGGVVYKNELPSLAKAQSSSDVL